MIDPEGDGLVDTHAHLDDGAFDADRDAVVAAATAAGVGTILNVGYRPDRWRATIELARRHPTISVVLGVHPAHADLFDDRVAADLREALRDGGAVAVGETGLDHFRAGPDARLQRRAFLAQLELARSLDLPVVIHQRAAEADLLSVLAGVVAPPRLVLHSFDGSSALARFAVDRGGVLGVGGLATRAASGALRAVLADVPLSSVVLETDAPYLVPAGVRGRRNEPAHLRPIAERLASLWRVTPEEMAAMTSRTARDLFRLNGRRPAPPTER